MEKNIREIMEVSKEFQSLKSDENALIKALNKLSEDKLTEIKAYLMSTSGEKINKIRLHVLDYITSNDIITKEVIEEIKKEVNELYPTDILHSWKSYFSLFYIFFYCDIRPDIKRQLKDLTVNLNNDLKLTEFSASKEVDFDGVQNFGADSAWIAIYNKKQPSQSSSLQLFVNFSYPEVSYGLYEYHNPNQYLTQQVHNIDAFSYKDMLKFLMQSRELIIKDDNPITIWKFSPGVNAIYWDEMNVKGIASIGWGNRDYTGLTTKSQVRKLAPDYFDEHMKSAGIICLINKAKEGDIVYAFKGRKEVIGRGIVQKHSQYSKEPLIDGSDHHNYLIVKWDEKFVKEKLLKKMVPMDSFANISERRQELESNNPLSPEQKHGEDGKGEGDDGVYSVATNQILFGPPGTGKTYNTVDYALKIVKTDLYKNEDRESNLNSYYEYLEKRQIVFTTFHQSYGYEDFVEGIKVVSEGDELTYPVESGIFKILCEDAADDPQNNYVIIIDEINRGNISKIFGELITLIEPDKRKDAEEEISVKLPYSKLPFSVPNNVHILGTMNTADASIAKLDIALRRRFEFIEMKPNPKLLTDTKTEEGKPIVVEGINLTSLLTAMNKRIEVLYDREHMVGHSFFMKLSNESTIKDLGEVFKKNIIPLLQEYFFDDWGRIHTVLDCLKSPQSSELHFVKKKYSSSINELKKLMGDGWDTEGTTSDVWELNLRALAEPDAYISIYPTLDKGSNSSEQEAK